MHDPTFHGNPPDLAPGCCLYQEHWDPRPCGDTATVHGIAKDFESGEACAKHRDVLEFHSKWTHPWTAACANGQFVEGENRCLASEELLDSVEQS